MFQVGDRIEGRGKNGTSYYPGSISAKNEDGTYQIKFDDGCFEASQPEGHLRALHAPLPAPNQAFSVGERIEGRWKGGATFYPGVVSLCHPNGTYQIKFDDGCVEEVQTEAHLCKLGISSPPALSSPSSSSSVITACAGDPFSAGQRIEARWKLSTKYYPGLVSAVNPDGSYAIKFDDGCFEPNAHVSHIRPVARLESASAGSLSIGAAVRAKYQGSPKYFIGTVASVYPDGTFRIDFLDKTHDEHVPLANIIPLDSAAALFVVSNGTLYRVDLKSGDADKLSSSWSKTTAMCRHQDHLFAIDSGSLYRISPCDGSHVRLPGAWSHTVALTSVHDNLFLIDNESLYRVDPQTGARARLSNVWPNVTGFS